MDKEEEESIIVKIMVVLIIVLLFIGMLAIGALTFRSVSQAGQAKNVENLPLSLQNEKCASFLKALDNIRLNNTGTWESQQVLLLRPLQDCVLRFSVTKGP